jgi:hypothetical protein
MSFTLSARSCEGQAMIFIVFEFVLGIYLQENFDKRYKKKHR